MTNLDPNSQKNSDLLPQKTKALPEGNENAGDDGNETIIDGANDLMNLPIQTLRDELIKRNFYPDIINKSEQWFLCTMLRQSVEMDQNSNNTMRQNSLRVHGGSSSGPIFSTDSNNSKEENNIEQNKEDPMYGLQEFDEKEFARCDPDEKLPKSSLINSNVSSISSVNYKPIKIPCNSKQSENPWCAPSNPNGLDKYVPIDILEALPIETQKAIQNDIHSNVPRGEIIRKYLDVLDGTAK